MLNVTAAGWLFLFMTCVYLPVLAVRSTSRLRQLGRMPSRWQYLLSVFVVQGMMLVLALLAARYEHVWLWPAPHVGARSVLLAVAFLAPTLGTIPLRWRWKSDDEKRRLTWMVPRRLGDLWWWVLVALVAGFVEEVTYRGVMFTLWRRVAAAVLGSGPATETWNGWGSPWGPGAGAWWLAVGACTIAFAVAHFVQGWRAMVVIVPMAVASHAIVALTGDLYTMMAIHFAYDLVAGVILLRLAQRDGFAPATQSA